MGCDCDTHCSTSTSCMCVFTHDDGICQCECTGPIVVTHSAATRPKKGLDTQVDVCARGADLATVAEFISRICNADLLIPAAKAKTAVSLELKNVSVAYVIEKVGLRVG